MTLQWTAHPAASRPRDALLALVLALASAALVMLLLDSPWLAVVAVAVFGARVLPFLVRTRYRIDDEQISARRLFVTRTRQWSELKSVEVWARAAQVSRKARPGWLDLGALAVYFDGVDRDAVVHVLRDKIPM